MKRIFKINYDKFIEVIFFIDICFFYAFPYQVSRIEIVLLILLLFNLKKIRLSIFLGWSLVYIFALFSSVIYSIKPEETIVSCIQITRSLLISNLLINLINSQEKIENIFKAFIAAGFILLVRVLSIFPISELGRRRIHVDEIFNSNDIALKLGISLIFLLYFIFIKNKKRFYNIVLALVFYIVIMLTGSRKGFFFENISILFFYLFQKRNKLKIILIFPFLIVLGIIFYREIMSIQIIYDVLGSRIEGLIGAVTQKEKIDESTLIRIKMIKDGIDYIIKRPLFGYGVDNYRYLSMYRTYSHNNYIELLTSIGIFGTIIYYFIHFYNLFFSFKFLKMRKSIAIPVFILTIMILLLDFGMVSYNTRENNFVLALVFLIINTLKKNKNLRRS